MQLIGPSSFVQTGLPGGTGRLRSLLRAPQVHALVRRAHEGGVRLEHYTRNQGRPDHGWELGATLTDASTAPAALAWVGRDLVALVPDALGLGVHRLTRGSVGAWLSERTLPTPTDQAVTAIVHRGHVHALATSAEGLVHWVRTPTGAWVRHRGPDAVATAAPALAATRDDVVAAVPTAAGIEAHVLTGPAWRRLGRVAPAAPDASPALTALADGTLLLATADPGSDGLTLRLGRLGEATWPMVAQRRPVAGGCTIGGVALVRSDLSGSPDLSRLGLGVANLGGATRALGVHRGWVQALVQEDASVFQWYREPDRWVRAACLRTDPGPALLAERASAKAVQVTGEHDTQPSPDGPRTTLSTSETRSGVRGTDLGVRVDVDGEALLLFGDTHWSRRLLATRDSIARITDPDADLPDVELHGGPLRFSGLGTTMTEYDVPLDAFALGGHWYAFASSNHFSRHQVMGRSVLARAVSRPSDVDGRSRRPFRFRTLAQVSDLAFVNVSCQWVPGDAGRDVLALWGTGSYRADDVRLAVLDAHPIADRLARARHLPTAALGLRYFAGLIDGRPQWSADEADAVPVVRGCLGELSVRWLPALGRYALLTLSGPEDPVGGTVMLQLSPTPWGPWSERMVLFDWIADGLSFGDPTRRFIRAFAQDDPVGDAIFGAQAGRPGGAYAPYLYDAAPDAHGVRLRYTLSTWNPYQVVLMTHHLTDADLRALGARTGPSPL